MKEIGIIDVPKINFLIIDSSGDPNRSQEYKDAVEALFSLSYLFKFMIKKTQGMDYAVMPLEGLWWVDDMSKFSVEDKDAWQWRGMMMQPAMLTHDFVGEAREELERKKRLPALSKVRFESFHEGTAAQIMYIEPFSEEGPTIQKIHEFIRKHGSSLTGKHHEIYLNDPRRVAPEKLKIILRQPMKSK